MTQPAWQALGRILLLWRGRAGVLLLGAVVSVTALGVGIALTTASGGLVAGLVTGVVAATPLLVRWLGPPRVVLRYLDRTVTHDALFRALADLRVWFFRGVAGHSAGGLGMQRAGDVLTRLVGDVEALDGVYLRVLVPAVGAALVLPVLVGLLWREGAILALCVGALFVLSGFVLPWMLARAALASGERLAAGAAGLRVACLDALHGLREVRAFAAEGRMLAAMQAREAVLLDAQRDMAGRTAWAGAAASLCAQAGILAVLAASGAVPRSAAILMFLAVAAFEAVGGLPRAGVTLGTAAASARRVLEAASGPPPVPDPAAPAPLPAGSALCFEGVRFAWAADRPPVFDGLVLDVPHGARVALLGPSGAGKSTLAALALKVAAPQAGRVLLGGTDIARLPGEAVRARIGWLAQATHLFDDTVRANLLLARPDADEPALWAALEAAQIAEVVRALPDGLDTYVGEAGAKLSGGQGRRLALARTLLSPAPVLILDEPCAGLDAETERAFIATLNEVVDGRSLILIAHRLTGVERLDRIYRLSAGKAVAAAA